MQQVTLGIGNTFSPEEKALRDTFVTELFKELGDGVPERRVTRLSVKQAVLSLPDPTQTAPENWTASCFITRHLVTAIRGQVEFRTADHMAFLHKGQTAVRRRGQQRAEEALAATLEGDPVQRACRL